MTPQRQPLLAFLDVPELDRIVHRRRGEGLAVGAVRQRADEVRVSAQEDGLGGGVDALQSHRVIRPRSSKLSAIGAEGDRVVVPAERGIGERAEDRAGLGVVDGDPAIDPTHRDPTADAVEGDPTGLSPSLQRCAGRIRAGRIQPLDAAAPGRIRQTVPARLVADCRQWRFLGVRERVNHRRVVDHPEMTGRRQAPEAEPAVVAGGRQGRAVRTEVERSNAGDAFESGHLADVDHAEARHRLGAQLDRVALGGVQRGHLAEVAGRVAPPAGGPREAKRTGVAEERAGGFGDGPRAGALGVDEGVADPPVGPGPQCQQSEQGRHQSRDQRGPSGTSTRPLDRTLHGRDRPRQDRLASEEQPQILR